MEDLIQMIVNNGLGVVCVAYLIYFQNTTMVKMQEILNSINTRLAVIEDKIENTVKGDK